MTATNHVITGAVIGAAVSNPVVALPLAFLSHFALDVLPHYKHAKAHTSQKFLISLAVDVGIASAILASIVIAQPQHWPLIVASAILAASPDLLWLYYWIPELRKKPKPFDPVARLLGRIQWSESSWGILLELPWFILMLYVFFRLTV